MAAICARQRGTLNGLTLHHRVRSIGFEAFAGPMTVAKRSPTISDRMRPVETLKHFAESRHKRRRSWRCYFATSCDGMAETLFFLLRRTKKDGGTSASVQNLSSPSCASLSSLLNHVWHFISL